jgi:hypothetical protein
VLAPAGQGRGLRLRDTVAVAHKQRKLELRAGLPPARGRKSHCGVLLAEAGAYRTRARPVQRVRLPDHGHQLASQPTSEQDTRATGIIKRWQWTWPPAPEHDLDNQTNQRRLSSVGRDRRPTAPLFAPRSTTPTGLRRYRSPRRGQDIRCGTVDLTVFSA